MLHFPVPRQHPQNPFAYLAAVCGAVSLQMLLFFPFVEFYNCLFVAKSYTVFSRVYTDFKNNFPWKLFNFNPKTVLLLIYDFICKTTLCSKCFTIGKRSFIAAYCRLECDQPIQVFLLVFVNISETALQKVFLVREKVF